MIAHPLDFVIGQAGQRRALTGDANFLYEINQIFAVEIEFFCERVNACHWVLILSNCLEATSPLVQTHIVSKAAFQSFSSSHIKGSSISSVANSPASQWIG